MNSPRVLVVSAILGVAAVAVLIIGVSHTSGSAVPVSASAAARTSLPGLQPAAAEPTLPGLADVHPAGGHVLQAPGPFDDRFVLRDLRLDSQGVQGTAEIISDVSAVLDFQALAGFYDAQGALVGTGRFVYHLDESAPVAETQPGPPSELQSFTIAVPAEAQGRAVAAAVGVPVLVNE